MASCTEKPKPGYSRDFAESIVDFAVDRATNRYIELPDLYEKPVRFIPLDNDENIILAEKLKAKGFVVTGSDKENFPLSGRQLVKVTLNKADCECEVAKIYQATPTVSQYIRSERIKCKRSTTVQP